MNIYLEAAQMVDSGREHYSCMAIGHAGKWKDGAVEKLDAYAVLFCPAGEDFEGPWGMKWGNAQGACRVLALCFAAAMHETGDL